MAAGTLTARREPLVPSAVLGMLIFVIAEAMFFAGLISAFIIVRSSASMGWPPPGQPRLPVEQTAINTAALLLSGALLFKAWRTWRGNPAAASNVLGWAIVLGAAFVGLQGVEWVALLREGLTLTSSSHGSFFYLIVGTHAAHALAALSAMGWVYLRLRNGKIEEGAFLATVVFWFFVVGLWPFIYARVYF